MNTVSKSCAVKVSQALAPSDHINNKHPKIDAIITTRRFNLTNFIVL